jgi:hypothetical protein
MVCALIGESVAIMAFRRLSHARLNALTDRSKQRGIAKTRWQLICDRQDYQREIFPIAYVVRMGLSTKPHPSSAGGSLVP